MNSLLAAALSVALYVCINCYLYAALLSAYLALDIPKNLQNQYLLIMNIYLPMLCSVLYCCGEYIQVKHYLSIAWVRSPACPSNKPAIRR